MFSLFSLGDVACLVRVYLFDSTFLITKACRSSRDSLGGRVGIVVVVVVFLRIDLGLKTQELESTFNLCIACIESALLIRYFLMI